MVVAQHSRQLSKSPKAFGSRRKANHRYAQHNRRGLVVLTGIKEDVLRRFGIARFVRQRRNTFEITNQPCSHQIRAVGGRNAHVCD